MNTGLRRIALLGVGLMGLPVGRRLLQAGHAVCAFNRTIAKAEELAASGATVAPDAATAVRGADTVLMLLHDGAAVAEVLLAPATLAALQPGTLIIDMSSIKPAQARAHAARLREHGVDYLDAPVSGGTTAAESGRLSIMVGGDAASFERASPVFEPLGTPTHVGPTGTGQLTKLANQMIVGATIGIVAEALVLAQRGGADPAKVRQAIRGGFAESRILELHGQRMVEQDFGKRAALTVQLKDMLNAAETARGLDVDLPLTNLVGALYGDATAHGFGDLDHSALFLEILRRSGAAPA